MKAIGRNGDWFHQEATASDRRVVTNALNHVVYSTIFRTDGVRGQLPYRQQQAIYATGSSDIRDQVRWMVSGVIEGGQP